MTLDMLRPGQSAEVKEIRTEGEMRRRLLDIGLVEGARVDCIGRSPGGDPSAYLICGAVIAIREKDSSGVLVHRISDGGR